MRGRPEYTDPLAAARVSDFIEAAEEGRWRIKRFTVTEEEYSLVMLRAMHEAGDDEFRRAEEARLVVPPGEYVGLQRRATEPERRDQEAIDLVNDGYVPVMSDTPAEIEEHALAIEHATGRVLIHGLGLGCLVSALLAKPEVTHIDVVEIDPDVIRLVAPYYDDPKVTIHQGDCLHMDWSPEIKWDYAWHDIWTHISSSNLDPETAEHGISYDMLFERFEARVTVQHAWAYEVALAALAQRERDAEERREWEDTFWAADLDTQVEMAYEEAVRGHLVGIDGRPMFPKGTPVPQRFLDFFESEMLPDLKARIREGLANTTREELEARRKAVERLKLGNPNEGLVT